MQAKLIESILGITVARQKQIITISLQEALLDFVHRGLYNEETLLQVLTVHTKDFTPQERAFTIYFAGRYVQCFLGGDEPLNRETAIKQMYKDDELSSMHPDRR